MTEYEAELQAMREKTARLRALSVGSRRRESENADRALIVETLARLRSRSCRREATISQRHSGAAVSNQYAGTQLPAHGSAPIRYPATWPWLAGTECNSIH